ncbi:MAG: helix-turn-helix domain-containing protein [Actinomycetota bacterium]|nr:helix-turn-helix domain-containing protein [Actinomycetota bacterium]
MADPHVVAVLVSDGTCPLELGVPAEVFGHRYESVPDPGYELRVVSDGGRPVRTSIGVELGGLCSLDTLECADTVIVVPATDVMEPSTQVVAALRAAAQRGARLVSICTGAFVLATAGLLDGRRATTHWGHTDALARRHPGVEVRPDVLFTDDGDVLTSAGSAAGLDVCLRLVEIDHGVAVADAVATRLVLPPRRRAEQAQQLGRPPAPDPPGLGISEVMAWAVDHLDEDLPVERLAARAALSPRTLARRFRDETGMSPYQWVMRQRIDRACALLETTDRPVEQIAAEVGFGSAQSLRTRFKQVMTVAPLEHRRCYRTARAG